MVWIVLVIAGLFEIVWAIGLKYSEGFTRLWPSVVTLVSLGISMVLLGVSVRVIPLGTAYAVWTGIGAVGTAIVGMVLFREPATVGRIVCLALVIGGIAGLKVLGR
jgi:quaternary ammonium compound-resistance protein SugE